jgi:cob(I)alamin adenosyltransferase
MSHATGSLITAIALGLVVLVLFAGLFNMLRGGNSNTSQRLMRLRVILQFVAIVVIMGVLYFRGTWAHGGPQPHLHPHRRRRLHGPDDRDLDAILARIQNDLFDLGADLATPASDTETPGRALRIVQAQVDRLEHEIDTLNADLAPLRSFVLPGGSPAAAALHIARTVCRRAERLMVDLERLPGERVSAPAMRYVNRLSDLLFVAARVANRNGAGDVLWVPGQNR